MGIFLSRVLPLTLVAAASCGGSPPEPATPVSSASPEAAESANVPVKPQEEKPAEGLPTACADPARKICLPPPAFVKRLCSGFFPDVALAMLGKGTPWVKAYLRVKSADAVNASGGVSSNDKLVFEEEFVVVALREADKGGMVVSGAGDSYDVLRWDGTCATLSGEELGFQAPAKPKYAKIPWKNLDDKVRDALLQDASIAKVQAERRKQCKGATMGEVSLKCVKADDGLSAAIVDYVRGGGKVPAPAKLP
jgi:hypothetical protein